MCATARHGARLADERASGGDESAGVGEGMIPPLIHSIWDDDHIEMSCNMSGGAWPPPPAAIHSRLRQLLLVVVQRRSSDHEMTTTTTLWCHRQQPSTRAFDSYSSWLFGGGRRTTR